MCNHVCLLLEENWIEKPFSPFRSFFANFAIPTKHVFSIKTVYFYKYRITFCYQRKSLNTSQVHYMRVCAFCSLFLIFYIRHQSTWLKFLSLFYSRIMYNPTLQSFLSTLLTIYMVMLRLFSLFPLCKDKTLFCINFIKYCTRKLFKFYFYA